MRRTCLLGIYALARQDKRVVFIGSDVSKQNLEDFSRKIPERFFMEGIYEGHIIGMAAGMAMNGRIPFVNTIASFLVRRCYEQLLLDLGLHNLPVRLVGSGAGAVYAPLGPTHMTVEDFAILRAIPNMAIVAPCDAAEMNRLLPQTLNWDGPLYIRLAKGGDKIVSTDSIPFRIGKAILLRDGPDVLFITTGITTQTALEASDLLARRRVGAAILHVHTIKPLDVDAILTQSASRKVIVTIEEHRVTGGLGSAVAETLMDAGVARASSFARIGFPDVFPDDLGSQDDILEEYGISAEEISNKVVRLLEG